MPKYWLDGIFDEDIVLEVVDNDFIPAPDFVGSINDFIFYDGKKGLGYYRVCKSFEEGEITPKFVLCRNFKYCYIKNCNKCHWYDNDYETRLLRCYLDLKSDNGSYLFEKQNEALMSYYNHYKRDGFEVSIE